MRRFSLLLIAAVLLPGALQAQGDTSVTAMVAQREADMWRFVKEGNPASFRANVDTTNYTGLYFDGRRGAELDVANYHWTQLDSYQLSEVVSREIDSANVMVTYKAVIKGRAGGARVQGPYWMATLWHRTGDTWLAVFHSEVKVPR